jgi:predicted acyl esterase
VAAPADAWPAGCAIGCAIQPTPLYLGAGLKLSFTAPEAGDSRASTNMSSDPAKPVPFRTRPIQPIGYDLPQDLVAMAGGRSARTGIGTAGCAGLFEAEVLTAPLKISGQPMANLIASTSGTDSDWVVKLIDVYPDEVAGSAGAGRVSADGLDADIFRGRYRESLETAETD